MLSGIMQGSENIRQGIRIRPFIIINKMGLLLHIFSSVSLLEALKHMAVGVLIIKMLIIKLIILIILIKITMIIRIIIIIIVSSDKGF